ncbi:Cytochrome c oxidase assembly protein cox19 [Loxospora ochrophaea]|nr:Cytochrome c oxidase assembly protein cox19 [Loxospora ochrophaea]
MTVCLSTPLTLASIDLARYDLGECKPLIADYLRCLRRVKGTNDRECRMMAKEYLQCRMEHNLMAPDELKNLGFAEEDGVTSSNDRADVGPVNQARDRDKAL